jgi:hypothetical protein
MAAQMEHIGIAGIRMFLILLWITIVSVIGTIAFHLFHLKKVSRIVGTLAIVSFVLMTWAYFSIWGFVWFH